MKHSTGNLTKAEKIRFAKMKALGCIACLLDGNAEINDLGEPVEPQIHHFLRGNKRISHAATAPLCFWHHNGLPYDGAPTIWFLANIGPSFHKHTRAFRMRYGTDDEVVRKVNEMIGDG